MQRGDSNEGEMEVGLKVVDVGHFQVRHKLNGDYKPKCRKPAVVDQPANL